MVNRAMFNTRDIKVPVATATNLAGGRAYSFTDEHALCQYVVTGTFNSIFYASAEDGLNAVKGLVKNVSPELIAKAAVYGHEVGHMKDVPAYLLAVLAAQGEIELLRKAFPRVVTNAKMLTNFVTIIRSGETGRKSFGSAVKRLIQDWITSRDEDTLFKGSIGQANPSFADIIKMVHPKPRSKKAEALYGYMLGKAYNKRNLPKLVKDFEAFKAENWRPIPDMPFRALTNCSLTADHWKELARNMTWNTLRMNLNTLARNDVFKDAKLTAELAAKISDESEVRRAHAFPYQLLTTYKNVTDVPVVVTNALQDALELSTANIPALDGITVVCPDLSGSMSSPITGNRGSVSSNTRVIDVAALMAASILRTNPGTRIIGWASQVGDIRMNPKDSIMTNATMLAAQAPRFGGGTNAQLPLQLMNQEGFKADTVVFISDYESWLGVPKYGYVSGTGMAAEWTKFQGRNPKAKLVCIDVQPNTTTQVPDMKNVLNVGGFSDDVFTILGNFVKFGSDVNFVDVVRATEL